MAQIKAIFFDCWNTIIKYLEREENFFSKEIYDLYIDDESKKENNVSREEFATLYSNFLREFYHTNEKYELRVEQEVNYALVYFNLKLKNGEKLSEVCEKVSRHFIPVKMDGIDVLLDYCKANNIKMYVLSNTEFSYDMTYYHIKNCYGGKFPFDGLLVSSDVGVKKPSPLFFNLGLRKFGYSKDEVIYVGDNFFCDVYGSNNAEFRHSIHFNPNKLDIRSFTRNNTIDIDKQKYISISNYQELVDLLEKEAI